MNTKAKWIVVVAAMLLVTPLTMAGPLGLGGSETKPGTLPPIAPPNYTMGPAPMAGGLAYGPLVSPVTGGSFFGTVTSSVWWADVAMTRLTFLYEVAITAGPPLVRMTVGAGDWASTAVLDNGIDVLGSSTAVAGPGPTWTDGAPYFHERDPLSGAPSMQYRTSVPGGLAGTTISAPGDFSARSWFETDATRAAIVPVGLLDSGKVGSSFAYAPVPAPGAVLLGAMGLGLVGWAKRRLS